MVNVTGGFYFIAFVRSRSATLSKSISFSYMESICSICLYVPYVYMFYTSYMSYKPICHSSQSVIVTTGIICPHLKPLYFRPQSIPRLQYTGQDWLRRRRSLCEEEVTVKPQPLFTSPKYRQIATAPELWAELCISCTSVLVVVHQQW